MKISVYAFAAVFVSFVLTMFTAIIAAGLTTKAFSALSAGQLAIASGIYALIALMGGMSIVIQFTMFRAAAKAAIAR